MKISLVRVLRRIKNDLITTTHSILPQLLPEFERSNFPAFHLSERLLKNKINNMWRRHHPFACWFALWLHLSTSNVRRSPTFVVCNIMKLLLATPVNFFLCSYIHRYLRFSFLNKLSVIIIRLQRVYVSVATRITQNERRCPCWIKKSALMITQKFGRKFIDIY